MALTGAQGGKAGADRPAQGGANSPHLALRPLRFAALALGMLALLTGLWSGLLRLGLELPDIRYTLPPAHGPLMVSGFLGTVISLERAVAIGRRWAYLAPLLSAAGAAALVAGLPVWLGALAMTAAGVVLVLIFVVILRRLTALFTVIMTLGALAWLIGNALWLNGEPIPRVVIWWTAFFVLTIAGERLELSRLLLPSLPARIAFGSAAALLLVGAVVSHGDADVGVRIAGAGMVLLPLWLARHDIARRTVRGAGLSRFIAACLLGGYIWLAIGGLLQLRYGALLGGAAYDAMLHAVFVGFVFVMIMAHAPIILPAVTGRAVPYLPVFYLPPALLHVSLAIRVAGDLGGSPTARQAGGILNEVAILLFLALTAFAVRRGVGDK